jgi:hypothetical protein
MSAAEKESIHLSSKCVAFSSNPRAIKKKGKERNLSRVLVAHAC